MQVRPRINILNQAYRELMFKQLTAEDIVVLAIDPGTHIMGWAVYKPDELVEYGGIEVRAESEISRLAFLATEFDGLIKKYNPNVVAIEQYFTRSGQAPTAVPKLIGYLLISSFRYGVVPIEINALHARKLALDKGYVRKEDAHEAFSKTKYYNKDITCPDALDAAILAIGGYKEHQQMRKECLSGSAASSKKVAQKQ